jgi:hypothetical protein
MIYLDSSALVKRYTEEAGTDFVKSILGKWGQALQSYNLNFISSVAPPASPHGLPEI